jgi:uncharacterized membrane protein YgcG
MNTELLSILRQITGENGTDAFDNIKLIGSALNKNAPEEAQPECEALILCLMADYHKELIGADEAARDSVKKSIAERLYNNEGMDADLCSSTLDLLEAALFGNEPETEEGLAEPDAPQTPPVPEKTEPADASVETKNIETTILETIIAEYKEQNARLVEEMAHLTKQKKQKHTEPMLVEKQLRKTKNKLIVFFVFLSLVIFVAILAAYTTMNDMNDRNTSLWAENYTLGNKIITLEKQYENSKRIWAINVTDMKVGNVDQYYRWITIPGVPLNASEVRYLSPVFIYDSPVTGSLTFYIKIIDSAGTVERGTVSPEGYSFSRQHQVKRGQSQEFDAGGWGSSDGGSYTSGIYTIELWCEGLCLYSGKIRLE